MHGLKEKGKFKSITLCIKAITLKMKITGTTGHDLEVKRTSEIFN